MPHPNDLAAKGVQALPDFRRGVVRPGQVHRGVSGNGHRKLAGLPGTVLREKLQTGASLLNRRRPARSAAEGSGVIDRNVGRHRLSLRGFAGVDARSVLPLQPEQSFHFRIVAAGLEMGVGQGHEDAVWMGWPLGAPPVGGVGGH